MEGGLEIALRGESESEREEDALGERAQAPSADHQDVGREGLELPQQLLPLAHISHHDLGLEPHLSREDVATSAQLSWRTAVIITHNTTHSVRQQSTHARA
jgi:hypothetical protein